jgi:hypothetical protein
MTQDIIEMARQAGFHLNMWQLSLGCEANGTLDELEAFAKLVEAKASAKEREACATVCDDLYRVWTLTDEDDIDPPDALDCKRAIRARGEA